MIKNYKAKYTRNFFIIPLLTYSLICLFTLLPAYSYEDCIVTSTAKLTDIKIEHNDIIDVFPLVTLMNDKNTLIVHPLKIGQSRFIVTKNKKEQVVFEVSVTENETKIKDVKGFDILTIDCPPGAYEYRFDLDEPPVYRNKKTDNGDFELDKPPVLRERSK